jgi:hypothetical protein
MIIYEITTDVRPDLRDDYEKYMRETHIADVLATGEFIGASIGKNEGGRFQIRYAAKDREELHRYLTEHAQRLRNDSEEHFPDGVDLSRTEWKILETYGSPH